MKAEKMPLHHLIRPGKTGASHPPLLVLLHGVGGNENDLFGQANTLDERFLIASVRAPFAQASEKHVWFHTEPLPGGGFQASAAHVEYSRQCVLKFIQQATQTYQTDPGHVFLMGFSQGAVIGLAVMLSEPEWVAGVVAMSGLILPELKSIMAKPERFKALPVLVLHGLQDETYPIAQARATRDLLGSLPVVLDYREYPIGHFLTPDSLSAARAWLVERLNSMEKEMAGATVPATIRKKTGIPVALPYKTRLGHVQLKVRNLDQAIAFYVRYTGMRLVERVGNAYAFLSSSNSHHELALQNVGLDALRPDPNCVGLYHLAFEVSDHVSLARAYKTLIDAGIRVTAVDHQISWSLYFNDPDGNGVEIYWDTRNEYGKADLWQGRDLPLEAAKILDVL